MALRGVAKARDYDYSNVGKQGRRTGITLKEGRRDEHGMEELDGVFSSPERSPVRMNGLNTGNDTVMGSEGMSIDEDGPGPTDFLSRSATRRSPFFPPPIARSPRKSGLSGSPRRTPALRSSPIVQIDNVSSSPTSARQRRGRVGEDETTSARQPLNDRRPNTAPISNGSRQKGVLNGYANDENLPINEDDDEEEEEEEEVNDISAYQNEPMEEDYGVHEISDDGYGDDSGEAPDTVNVENDDHSEEEPSPLPAASSRTKKRKSPATNDDVDVEAEDRPQGLPKRRGRPQTAQVEKGAQAKTNDQRPAKKAKSSKAEPKSREPLDPQLEKVVENHVNRTGPLKGRSLYILKREVPTDQQAAHTRSGRVSVRPLAYWRNERCVYGDGEADVGQRYPLSTIKEIIRTEELEPEKKPGKKRKPKKSKSKKQEDDSDDDEDERDKWEAEDGVLHGYIKKWDSDKQAASNEEEISEIAFSPSGIETRDVKDSTFRVAKLLSQPFFGSGIVELPAKGVKKPKNSKRMHMVFYVCYGRVQVDINGVQFTAGKGCIFQVHRGNHYSFANTTPKEARLFFTQAFMPNGSDNDNDHENTQSSKAPAAAEPEPEPEENSKAAAPAGKGRGRGRGRGKAAAR
ncbi:Cupin domain protein [Talaromyces stipitatus ATCC 10500]|uniref:CENP-C homolog n=1 Tax=Talaromyces stipitatus (strain ATCC 10500 / CBS 375.48 / QM 6759 / NRRL 1006) TaxID=441959 RepID=B8MIG7_TALSN|nr:Cupin domain protein [Talaromyces stipitatus ATCC 10500]EED15061.1 Cupin domain protein [Talaromyces stipitatus ATCC 10500]